MDPSITRKQAARRIVELFFAVQQHHAIQYRAGEGRTGYALACVHGKAWECGHHERSGGDARCCGSECAHFAPQSATEESALAHLSGNGTTLAAYPLGPDARATWGCVDVDVPDGKWQHELGRLVHVLRAALRHNGLASHVEFSGAKGFHLWLFFAEPVPAERLRAALCYVVRMVSDDLGTTPGSVSAAVLPVERLWTDAATGEAQSQRIGQIEIFPKQCSLRDGEVGSCVKLPMGVHQGTGRRCDWVLDDLQPVPDQWEYLLSIQPLDPQTLDDLVEIESVPSEDASSTQSGTARQPAEPGTRDGLAEVLACEFVKHCRENATDLPEPLWYAMLTNLAPLKGGVVAAHALSRGYSRHDDRGHRQYDRRETDAKLEHAARAPGPHTCEWIAENGFRCPLLGLCLAKSPLGLAGRTRRLDDGTVGERGETELERLAQELTDAPTVRRTAAVRRLTDELLGHADADGLDGAVCVARESCKADLGVPKGMFDKLLRDAGDHLRREEETAQKLARECLAEEQRQALLSTEVTLADVHGALRQCTSSPYSADALELALAVAVSCRLPGLEAPLWLMLVGAPSSDKTETALVLRELPDTVYLDTVTENALVSGYMGPDGRTPVDLLSVLDGKCLVVKDYTALFSCREDVIRKLLGDLCAVYDGEFAKWTGTRGPVQYSARFSHLGCITPVALSRHHRYLNLVGSRFLFYRSRPLDAPEREEGLAVGWTDREKPKGRLRELGCALCHQLQVAVAEVDQAPKVGQGAKGAIDDLAQLLARGRATARTRRVEGATGEGRTTARYETAEVQVEEPFRAQQQLRALAVCLAAVHGRCEVTAHELELVRRVVLSSMPADRWRALGVFQGERRAVDGVTRRECAEALSVSRTQATRGLEELRQIGLLRRQASGELMSTGGGGPHREDTAKAEACTGEGDATSWVYRVVSQFAEQVAREACPLDHIGDLTQKSP